MRSILIFCSLFLIVAGLRAQDVRQVGPFDQLIVTGKLDVTLEAGDAEEVIIDALNLNEDDVNLTLRDGELKVGLVDGWFRDDSRVRVTVRYRSLNRIRAQAGAVLASHNMITGDRLEIKASSGAEVRLEIEADVLEAGAAEGAQLELTGQVNTQYVTANTGGEYDGDRLEADRTEVRANTGGEAWVIARTYLDASAHTGGEVFYKGDPEEKYTKSNLAGEIRSF
ncbi:MAG: DUF2807 domain-containing protein [Lewinella sp.]|nr:DUF2807 domain-containing protein [Lewinella sp.]